MDLVVSKSGPRTGNGIKSTGHEESNQLEIESNQLIMESNQLTIESNQLIMESNQLIMRHEELSTNLAVRTEAIITWVGAI